MPEKFTIDEIKETHQLYDDNLEEWKRYMAAFEGIKSIIKECYIKKHEREPQTAYERRIEDLYGFGYSKSVVKILNFYLFKKPPDRSLKDIENNDQWNMFWEDTDLNQNDWDTVMMDIELYASILGHIGILIDKSPKQYETIQQEKENKVYPYIAKYMPQSILDWEWKRDENNRPYLAMVKLIDNDEQYRIWTIDEWAIYKIPEDENGKLIEDGTQEVELVDFGENKLGFVPFFWHYNMKSKEKGIGVSDLSEIARLDISIIKNASQLEEIINFAAFPMMIKAMRNAKPDEVASPQADDEVSVQAVQEYDPEYPESKPEWMKTEVGESITAILENIKNKIAEIYRAANIGGLAATEIQTQAKSGTALKTEFQMLNSELVSKAINLEKTENKVAEYWLKWQKLYDSVEISFKRSRTYDLENLQADLENALTAKTLIISKKFNELLQKQTARQVIPTMTEDDVLLVDQEIEESIQSDIKPTQPIDEGIEFVEEQEE